MGTNVTESERIAFRDPFEAIEGCFDRGWTDGLPIVPPTPEGVQAFLDRAGLTPAEILGEIPTREVVVTAEAVAINAVMAGCLPEYMPVVVAAMRAALDERANLHSNSASLAGPAQVLIINGPVRTALGINCKAGVFGPGFRANATIGRAVRLVIRNVCLAIPGSLDRAAFSHPGRYSWCFGENEEESPWIPLHAQQGLPLHSSAVTFFASMGCVAVLDGRSRTAEGILETASFVLRASGWTAFDASLAPFGIGAVLVVGPEHMRVMAEAGWSKRDIQQFLWPRITAPPVGRESPSKIASPDALLVVAAGGPGMPQSWWLTPHAAEAVTKQVQERGR